MSCNHKTRWRCKLKPGFHPNATHATHETQAIAFRWKPGLTQSYVVRETLHDLTHIINSRVSIAFIRFCDSVCLSLCPHDKIKTTETKIAKLSTGLVHHDTFPPINIRSKGQKVKSQNHSVKKCKTSRRDSRAAPSRSAVTPLNETAPHGRRESCTLSSAQPLVDVNVNVNVNHEFI